MCWIVKYDYTTLSQFFSDKSTGTVLFTQMAKNHGKWSEYCPESKSFAGTAYSCM